MNGRKMAILYECVSQQNTVQFHKGPVNYQHTFCKSCRQFVNFDIYDFYSHILARDRKHICPPPPKRQVKFTDPKFSQSLD